MKAIEIQALSAFCAPSKPHHLYHTSKSGVSVALVLVATLTLVVASTRAETISGTGISSLPYTITTGGLYHLTRNFTDFNGANEGAAITINAGPYNVVLDMNEHVITGTNKQHTVFGIKGSTTGSARITVRNGTVRGFAEGSNISGTGFLIEDMTIVGCTLQGIFCVGTNGFIRNNRVLDTGNHSLNTYAMGIYVRGPGMRIINNDISLVSTAGSAATGIWLTSTSALADSDNTGSVLENNRVTSAFTGIYLGFVNNVLIVNSRITSADKGIWFDNTTGKYRDTLTSGVTTPYTGGTDAGNNQ
jgi:hypothetical protein